MPRQKYPGKKRTYTPEQTDRYLSQRARWARAFSLEPMRVEVLSEETIKDGCSLVTTRELVLVYQGRHGLEWKVPVIEIKTCVALDCVLSP